MMEILKSIDWTQVGPFTALLLIIAVIGLGLAPFYFRYLGKRSEADEAEKKRDYERESKKDDALIRIVDGTQKLGENVAILAANVNRLSENLDAFEGRVTVKIDTVEKNLSARIDRLSKPK